MSFTGEINQHLQGNKANVNKSFRSLNLLSSNFNSLNSLGALVFSGSSLSIGRSSFSLSGNATELNFGRSYANRMLCLFDGGTLGTDDQYQYYGLGVSTSTLRFHVDNTGFHRFYTGTSSSTATQLFEISHTKSVSTANNTLDDGSGNGTFQGLTVSNSTEAVLMLDTTAVSGSAAIVLQINNNNKTGLTYTTGSGFSISDLANSSSWLFQSGGISGNINTLNNILDDGTGTIYGVQIFSKSYVVAAYNKGFFLNDGSGAGGANYFSLTSSTSGGLNFNDVASGTTPVVISSSNRNTTLTGFTPLILQSTTAGGCGISFLTSSGSTSVGSFAYSSISGWNLQNGAGNFIFSQGGGTTSEKSLHSNNNILDDGSGVLQAANDVISLGTFRGRKSSYSSQYSTQITFADNSGAVNWWQVGNDVSGNKGLDFYIYGQGSSGKGLCFAIQGTTGVINTNTLLTNRSGTSYSTTTTISAADIIKGIVYIPVGTASITLTLPTPASIYTALGLTAVGLNPTFTFKLITLTTNNVTLSAGAGWTVFTNNQTGNHNTLNYEIQMTSSTTANIYGG